MSTAPMGPTELAKLVDQELGISSWIEVGQTRINEFAHCTEDHQWIHVDVARAAKESPAGGTIAHGYLTLSLMAQLRATAMDMPPARIGINYGLNKVRFTGPVPAGSRVRAVLRLTALETLPENGVLMTWLATVYRDGSDKPVLVAETLGRRFE